MDRLWTVQVSRSRADMLSLDIERFGDKGDRPETGRQHSSRWWRPKSWAFIRSSTVASPATRHRFTFEVSPNVADGIAPLEMRIGVPYPIGIALKALTIAGASLDQYWRKCRDSPHCFRAGCGFSSRFARRRVGFLAYTSSRAIRNGCEGRAGRRRRSYGLHDHYGW